MIDLFQKVRNTLQFHYYRKKNGWEFPSNMAHTSGARMADGTYEFELTRSICKNIRESATVIDIGANVGYYSRLFAQAVKESGKVIAFEIDSENYRCLCKNVADYDQVIPVAMAVASKNGILEIHRSSHSSCHSILNTGNYQNHTFFKVVSVKLDSFWDLYLERAVLDCIKIDVEGAEILVLEGMQKMLDQKAVKILIVEFCPQIIINSDFDPLCLYDQIMPGFTIQVVESEYKNLVEDGFIKDKKQFETLQSHLLSSGDFVNCNLFCEQKQ